jgi:hypothetical protein
MNPQSVRDVLRDCLETFWTEVDELSVEDAKAVLDEFILACVREDFRAKFKRELNSRRTITERFFCRPAEFDPTVEIEKLLGLRPKDL